MLERGRAHRAAWLLAVLATGQAGCGADASPQSPPSQRLTGEERQLVRGYETRIARHCVRMSRALVDPAQRPTPAQEADAFRAADELLALARAKPAAVVGTGQDLRLFVGDVLENLEGSNCDPRMLEHLESGLTTLPRE